MINYNQFRKIKELQQIGTSQTETAKQLGICRERVRTWWHKTEADFWSEERKISGDMDNYRAFVLDLLKICPQIRGTNVYLKLQENFPSFSVKMPAFYKFVKQLRIENDLEQFTKRLTTVRESLPPGEEMQVDFGEFRMRTMYGTWVKVYFACFVLSYSNFRYIHFEPNPFSTDTAITAHNFAFKYFGGRTKKILYDLDGVFVQSENFGNIIFVKKWEEYVRKIGFATIYCRPHDPQTKGRVEGIVNFCKRNFLDGTTYYGCDALRYAALKWLDGAGNEYVSSGSRKQTPREAFVEEQKHLIPVHANLLKPKQKIVGSLGNNTVHYNGKQYELPLGTNLIMSQVQVEEVGDELYIFCTETGDLICTHKISICDNWVIKLENQSSQMNVSPEILKKHFPNDDIFAKFFDKLKSQNSRYFAKQCIGILQAIRHYTNEQLGFAFEHCLKLDICNFSELMAFLILKHDKKFAKAFLSKEKIYYYTRRSKELEVLYADR